MSWDAWMRALIILIFVALLPAVGFSSDADTVARHERLVETDLYRLRTELIKNRSAGGIARLNRREIRDLELLTIPARNVKRVRSVDPKSAQSMLASIELHPVVSHYALSKYNTKASGIGFCFGRATYAHLMALDMGVQKEAIKKAFVVGPMKAGDTTWGFHVATLIKSGDDWLAIDSVPGTTPLKLQDWFAYFKKQSVDRKLMLFITEPEKFTPGPQSYTQIQMGLNLSREQDWYSGYFQDLMKWFADRPNYTEVGLATPEDFKQRLTTKPYDPITLQKVKRQLAASCRTVLTGRQDTSR